MVFALFALFYWDLLKEMYFTCNLMHIYMYIKKQKQNSPESIFPLLWVIENFFLIVLCFVLYQSISLKENANLIPLDRFLDPIMGYCYILQLETLP